MKRRELLQQGLILLVVLLTFAVYWVYSNTRDDTLSPEITVEEGILELSVEDSKELLLQGISAYDNKDGDVTASILVERIYGINDENLVTVSYAAFDSAGNVARAERQVRYVDYESPRFTLERSLTFGSESTFDILSYVRAEDILDGDIQRRIRSTLVSDTGSVGNIGSHQVLVQVTNSLGDSVELTLPVEVYTEGKYNAQLELSEYLLYLDVGAAFHEKAYLSVFEYAGREVAVNHTIPSDVTVKIEGPVNTRESGVYPVYYTVSRQVGDTIYTGYACLIVVITE